LRTDGRQRSAPWERHRSSPRRNRGLPCQERGGRNHRVISTASFPVRPHERSDSTQESSPIIKSDAGPYVNRRTTTAIARTNNPMPISGSTPLPHLNVASTILSLSITT